METKKRDILNPDRFTQPLLFKGLESGRVCFTDIDFLFESDDKVWVFGDCKMQGTELPTGQRLVLERMTRDFQKAGKKAIAIVTSHNTPTTEPVLLADTTITKYYDGKKWVVPKDSFAFSDGFKKIGAKWKIKKLENLINSQ